MPMQVLTIVLIFWLFSETKCAFMKENVYFQFYSSHATRYGVDARFFYRNGKLDINIPNSGVFDAQKQTFMYIHGYMSPTMYQNAHVKSFYDNIRGPNGYAANCCNFIVLNWSEGNLHPNYWLMFERARDVAEMGFQFLQALVDKGGLKLEELTIVGHSIGAHIGSIIAELFRDLFYDYIKMKRKQTLAAWIFSVEQAALQNANAQPHAPTMVNQSDERYYGLIGAIVGADPAGPGFNKDIDAKLDNRLRPGLAIYTIAIHTNAKVYGIELLTADADYFSDGGTFQTCCDGVLALLPVMKRISICSHTSAARVYWRTLRDSFKAIRCDNRESILEFNVCDQKTNQVYEVVDMGGNLIYVPFANRPRGIFYTETVGKNCDLIEPVDYDMVEDSRSVDSVQIRPRFQKVSIGRIRHYYRAVYWHPPTADNQAKEKQLNGAIMDEFKPPVGHGQLAGH